MSRPRLLIFGATGLLGSELTRQFSNDYETTPLSHRQVEITDSQAVQAVISGVKPYWVINAAAYSDVDGCETNSDKARIVNTAGAVTIARACAETGSRLVFFSSDYVFDGNASEPYTEESQPNPINVYGRTKFDAEQGIGRILPDALIVRTAWLYGVSGRDFIKAIVSRAKHIQAIGRGDVLRVVDDQVGSPTSTSDLIEQLKVLLELDCRGLYHCTNRGQISWFEYARQIVTELSIAADVQPCSSAESGRAARRPAYSVLNNARLQKEGLDRMRDYRLSLLEYLRKHREELLHEL